MISNKWKTVSFLAAAVMGTAAFAFAGCTVTSGNPDDGPGTVKDDSGTTTTDPDSGTTTTDSGTDSGPAATCTTLRDKNVQFGDTACQACLDAKCCNEQQACFNAPNQPSGSNCNEYAVCVDDCYDDNKNPTQEGKDKCVAEICVTAAPEFQPLYERILDCGAVATNCKTECGL